MLETVILALITAIPPTIVALATFYQVRVVSSKTDGVHVLVNSNLAQVKADLAIAKEQIVRLTQLLEQK